jgi:hypothetical protein
MSEFLIGVALVTAIITCVTAFLNLRSSKRNNRKIQEIHILVNSKFTTVVDRVDQLTKALEEARVDVPPEPRKPGPQST